VELAVPYSRNLLPRQVRAFSGKDVTAPTTMSHDKMKTDARYQPVNEVPESLGDASMSEITTTIHNLRKKG
jgi:hypothetical protein